MAGFEFVELLDGHHVDRSQPFDLAAQRGDRFFRAERPLRGCFGRQSQVISQTDD